MHETAVVQAVHRRNQLLHRRHSCAPALPHGCPPPNPLLPSPAPGAGRRRRQHGISHAHHAIQIFPLSAGPICHREQLWGPFAGGKALLPFFSGHTSFALAWPKNILSPHTLPGPEVLLKRAYDEYLSFSFVVGLAWRMIHQS